MLSNNEQAREHAARVISHGGVIAFRTDTFYGLGADPLNAQAVSRIRELKGREEAKPILLLISDSDQVQKFLVAPSQLFEAIARRHWPGPLTLIGVAREGLPMELTAESGTIGLRLPDTEAVRTLVRACGGALTATSANRSGDQPARTAQEVEEYFPNGIDLIIDGGEVSASQPSTVLDLTGKEPVLIREGAIKLDHLDLQNPER